MASLYVWKGNEATVCRFHKTPSDWDYEPLSRSRLSCSCGCSRSRASLGSRRVSPARWATGRNDREVH